MLLVVELLFIFVLAGLLIMLYKSERISLKKLIPKARVEEYWSGRERRQHVRLDKKIDVNYIISKKPLLKKDGMTVNISEGGMKLLLDEKLAKGTILDLELPLQGEKRMVIEGEVIWSDEAKDVASPEKRLFHSGIKFLSVKAPPDVKLGDYIKAAVSDSNS